MPAGLAVPYEIRSHAGGAIPAKLNTTMAVSALSFTLQPGQGASYPDGTSGAFFVSLDAAATGEEHVRVVSRSGDTFNLNSLADRGLMGTTALQHQQGAAVSHGWAATEADEAGLAAHYTLGQVANKGDMLYADSSTTMAALPKGTPGQAPVYQADSSVAAGNPIPAPHTHVPADIIGLSQGLLARAVNAGPYNVSSTVGAALDLTHMTLTIVVPSTGDVLLSATGNILFGSDGNDNQLYWVNHSGGATVGAVQKTKRNDAAGVGQDRFYIEQLVTGLTPSASLTLDLFGDVSAGAAGCQYTDMLIKASSA